jgi:glycine oxidase
VDVLVVGGGIIGLAVAWRARQRGLSVLLLDRNRVGAAASSVAAGMLAPVTEVEFDQARRRTVDLGLRSAALWSSFAAELGALTDVGVGYRRAGTLMVARDADDARELERQFAFRESLGVKALRLLPSQARERETPPVIVSRACA